MGEQEMRKVMATAVYRLLRPLVVLLLRNGMSFGAFSDLAKQVYVDVATREFELPGRKQSVSRVSVITGLTRKEVTRVQGLPPVDSDEAMQEEYNRAARIVNGWVRDKRFQSDGDPATLSETEFGELVKVYGADVPVRAVLDELIRVGAVQRDEGGQLQLLERAYIPRTGELEGLAILGVDVAGLIDTIDQNLRAGEDEERLFQRKVYYDNLPEQCLPELKALTRRQGQELLEKLNEWMAQHDRDTNPDAVGTGRRAAGIGVYYFERNNEEGQS
jgi:hypothetical protein